MRGGHTRRVPLTRSVEIPMRPPRRRPTPHVAALLLALATTGCAAGHGPQAPGPFPKAVTPASLVRTRDLIARDQLLATGQEWLHDALRQVRGDLFRPRVSRDAVTGEVVPAVYVNGYHQGDLAVLQTLTTEVVDEVRFVGATESYRRFGTFHPGGVLMVRLKLR